MAIACGLMLCVSGCHTGAGRAESQRELVKAGMTQSEVKEILGDPDSIAAKDDREGFRIVVVWTYQYDTPCTMYIAPTIGMLTIIFCYPSLCAVIELGMTRSGRLMVEFGSDLRVLRAVTTGYGCLGDVSR